jgi:outer membrane putative beta-barrel porin/alpha-amylase
MRIRVALVCVSLSAGAPLRAQTPGVEMPINPDRPDLTNSPRLVDPGIVQIEAGVIRTRQDAGHHAFSSPIVARIGVRDWLEAQVGDDGLLVETEMGERATGIGNVRLGAKVRLLADSTNVGRFTILPQASLPAARGARQLGSGDPDYTLTFMTGADVGSRAHIDTNYTIGAIGSGGGRAHFVQHVLSGSMSVALTGQSSAYFEGFGISRQEAGGRAMTAIDTGVIYTIGTYMAVDGGIEAGVSGDAPAFAVFGGVSVALGHARAAGAAAHAHTRPGSPTSASADQGRDSGPRR